MNTPDTPLYTPILPSQILREIMENYNAAIPGGLANPTLFICINIDRWEWQAVKASRIPARQYPACEELRGIIREALNGQLSMCDRIIDLLKAEGKTREEISEYRAFYRSTSWEIRYMFMDFLAYYLEDEGR